MRGVDDWEYTFANIAMQIGELDGLMKSYKDDGCPDMTGYSAYLNNIYFNGKIAQIGDDTIDELQKKIRNYNVNFSEHVDVVTVDDVGNVVGGLYTEENGENGNSYRLYRIHSAITVRNNNKILTVCADNETADAGTYKLYAQPHGCSCLIKDSTLYITAIDNIKDGIAGTVDDSSFDYDKMRQIESCSVDILVDCEGRATITKSFPITIKHQSEPFIGADITNENSAVSWNTKSRSFIGLPIVVDMKMWHNNTLLDVSKICVKTDSGKLISSSDKKDSVTIVPGLKVKSTIAQTAGGSTDVGRIGHVEIMSIPDDIENITNLNIIGEAVYAGVRYERTFTHTIRKSADVNVYQLVPSADQILAKFKDGTRVLDTESITCAVHCNSSDDKHYILTEEEVNAAGLIIQYSIDNGATKNNYGSAIQINTDISSVIFYLIQGDFIWDQETVPVILDGVDGKGVEFIFFLQDSWKEDSDNPAAMDTPTILDESSKKEFQVENFCPYNIKKTDRWTDEPSGVGMNHRYEFYSMRKKVNGVWQPFSPVKLWNKYTVDGKSNYVLDLTNEQSFLNCDDKGTVLSSYEDTAIQLFKGTEYAWDLFDINIVAHNISYSYVPESHIIQPSNITADNASIVVTATLKADHDIVLTTVYKIYKSYAGKGGVVYSLMPSVNTIHLMANGDYIDKTISIQVKKTIGETTTILTTSAELLNNNLTLNYLLNGNSFGISNPASISSETVCDTNSHATFLLMKDGNVVDKQRINCVSDGESGTRGDKGNNGCIQRVWQTFTEGQIYRNDTKAEETETDGLNYLDFVAVPDSSMTSGWKVYQCATTHTSGKQAELSDTKLWKELSINAQSAFFTFLIAKNANVQILSSARVVIPNDIGETAAGLANGDIPLWVGNNEPSKAPFNVTKEGIVTSVRGVFKDAEVRGNFYTPYFTIDDNNINEASTGLVDSYEVAYKRIDLDKTGLNLMFCLSSRFGVGGEYIRVSLPVDEKYIGAEANIFCLGIHIILRNMLVLRGGGFDSTLEKFHPMLFYGQKVKLKCIKYNNEVIWVFDSTMNLQSPMESQIVAAYEYSVDFYPKGWDISPTVTNSKINSRNPFEVKRKEVGVYRIEFPSDFKYVALSLQIIPYGVGYALINGGKKSSKFCKATILDKGLDYFEIGVSDGDSARDGNFGFIILDHSGINAMAR